MRKILASIALLSAFAANAQIDLSQTRFGITAGGNYSRVRNAHNPSGPRYTMQAGVLALIPVDRDDQFYIQPEVTYYGAGETGKDKNAVGKPGYDAVYGNSYISVPIYFKGYFSEAESEFFGLVGPRFNFLINQNIKNAPARYTEEGDTVRGVYVNGKAKGFNFGIGAGVGFSYKRQLELAVRYDAGLSNTYPNMIESYTGDKNTEKKKSEQVLSVVLSYIFD